MIEKNLEKLNKKLYKRARKNFDNNNDEMFPIRPRIRNKTVYLIGTGNSLLKYEKNLIGKSIIEDEKIFCVDTSVDYLVEKNIPFDYCVLVESQRIKFRSKSFKGKKLYAYCGSHPDTIKEWKKKGGQVEYFEFNYDNKYILDVKNKLPRLAVGFVSSSVVFGICSEYGANILILIGQEHAFNNPKDIYLDRVWNGEFLETKKETYKRIEPSLYKIPKKYKCVYKYTFQDWWNFAVYICNTFITKKLKFIIIDLSNGLVNAFQEEYRERKMEKY